MTAEERKLGAEVARLKDKLAKVEADQRTRQTAFENGPVAGPVRKLILRGIGPNGLPDARPKKKNRSE
jgi:hypothetical protein